MKTGTDQTDRIYIPNYEIFCTTGSDNINTWITEGKDLQFLY